MARLQRSNPFGAPRLRPTPPRREPQPPPKLQAPPPESPADTIGRHMRWQVLIVLGGLLLLTTILSFSTFTVTTVLVPDRGGVYREGIAGMPRYLNPLLCDSSEADLDLCNLLFRGLTTIDKHGRVIPDLAAEWEITEENLVYTFRLRPDQYWHDGVPITADDVLFTIGILQDPEVYSLPDLTGLWRSVEVTRLNDLTVQFRLAEPFTPFLDYTSIGLLPQHLWQHEPAAELATKSLLSAPIGSGPYKVVQSASSFIRLEPSPYSSSPTRPYIPAIEFIFYPDHASLFAAFIDGEIDGVSKVLVQDINEAALRDDMMLFSSIQSEYLTILFNLDNPSVPFLQEKAVRQALHYGLNRQRLVDEVLAGQGIVAHSPMPPENWAYHPGVQRYTYDRERASQLLDEAGWVDTNGDGVRDNDGHSLRFLLYTNDDPVRVAISERIAADWRAIGVDAQPVPVTFAGLVSDFLNPRRFDAALIGWELTGDPDPYPLWHSTQASGGGQNYTGWSHEEADEIMEEARAIVDETARRNLYIRFQDIFAEETPAILLYYPVYTYGVRDRVHNVQIGVLNKPVDRFDTFDEWYILTRRVPANQAPSNTPPTPPAALITR
jgi:peptide/nickel transport system substrate-binding protein